MALQFEKDKCGKMHIGKTHNQDICTDGQVEILVTNENRFDTLVDKYEGKETMKKVNEKPS